MLDFGAFADSGVEQATEASQRVSRMVKVQ